MYLDMTIYPSSIFIFVPSLIIFETDLNKLEISSKSSLKEIIVFYAATYS